MTSNNKIGERNKKILKKLNSGDASYHSIQISLLPHLLPKNASLKYMNPILQDGSLL
jgi:hypothetical protein